LNIQCTQKLLDKLKVTAALPSEQNDFFDWHASHLLIDRHNTVLLTNNLCRYSLVLYGLKASDFKKLDGYIQQALSEVLLAEDVDKDTIEKYFELAGPIYFTKTGNRSITAQVAQIGQVIPYLGEGFEDDQIIQTDFNLMFGSYIQKIGQDYIYPRDLLLAAMQRFKQTGETIIPCGEIQKSKPAEEKAFVLKVELICEGLSIWRKLAVPAKCTFEKFHRILQVSFNWQDEHLHQFQVIADNGNIVAQSKSYDGDDFGWETQQFIDCFSEKKRISAYLPAYRSIRYLYDFGDDWLHLIELEETIESFDGKLPYCLDGEGTAPLEDVGGEYGYLEFLSIVENKANTKEKREMLEWAESLNWQKYDLQGINNRLRIF